MNERIRELAKQAGAHFDTRCLASNPVQYKESVELWDDRIEKFAELIVRECAEVAFCNFHVSGGDLGDLLKEHFGVEE
jgi:hypothetical protein